MKEKIMPASIFVLTFAVGILFGFHLTEQKERFQPTALKANSDVLCPGTERSEISEVCENIEWEINATHLPVASVVVAPGTMIPGFSRIGRGTITNYQKDLATYAWWGTGGAMSVLEAREDCDDSNPGVERVFNTTTTQTTKTCLRTAPLANIESLGLQQKGEKEPLVDKAGVAIGNQQTQ